MISSELLTRKRCRHCFASNKTGDARECCEQAQLRSSRFMRTRTYPGKDLLLAFDLATAFFCHFTLRAAMPNTLFSRPMVSIRVSNGTSLLVRMQNVPLFSHITMPLYQKRRTRQRRYDGVVKQRNEHAEEQQSDHDDAAPAKHIGASRPGDALHLSANLAEESRSASSSLLRISSPIYPRRTYPYRKTFSRATSWILLLRWDLLDLRLGLDPTTALRC